MPVHLTSRIFRQILYNKPISHVQCSRYVQRYAAIAHFAQVPRRTIFGFSRKPQRRPKETVITPGFNTMAELDKMEALRARPPPASRLAWAFKKFFAVRAKTREPLEDVQVSLTLKTLLHLQQADEGLPDFGLPTIELQLALDTLKNGPGRSQKSEDVRQLAETIYNEIKKRTETAINDAELAKLFTSSTVASYVEVLSRFGNPLDGRQALLDHWKESHERIGMQPWTHVLQNFALLQDNDQLRQTIKILDENGISFTSDLRALIVQTLAKANNLDYTREWYESAFTESLAPSLETKLEVLHLCIRHKAFEWGQPILDGLLEESLDKKTWDIVFMWAGAKGKGIEEIARMMDVMVRRGLESENPIMPDIETFNGLIHMANENNDSYRAEQYLALAQKRGMELNAETYLMQCDYRLKVGDVDGARHAYKKLQEHEVPPEKDIALLNRLIVTLSDDSTRNYDSIMAYVEEVTDRKGKFEPPTVAALAQIHLDRDEAFDLIDLFETHVYQYGTKDRELIIAILVKFCLNRSVSSARVWDAYEILRETFPEVSNIIRLQLMNSFFARRRSDMGLHVFGHIRQREVKELRPDAEAYIQCFAGLGSLKDIESLQLIHNMLKLDAQVEPDTRLFNALMLAYTACDQPNKALYFWEDIVYSREGPTYNSIQIALHACELETFGDRRARDIWAKLQKYQVEVSREMYAAYLGAIAGHGLVKEVIQLVNETKTQIGSGPDTLM